jgi:DNA-binding transcriptional MerR regulator
MKIGGSGSLSGTLSVPGSTGYLRKEITPALGVDGRTIQSYTDRGLIIPEIANPVGRGTKRQYSKKNIFEMLVIQVLIKHGITLGKMKPIIEQVGKLWQTNAASYLAANTLKLILYKKKHDLQSPEEVYTVELINDAQSKLEVDLNEFDSILGINITDALNATKNY